MSEPQKEKEKADNRKGGTKDLPWELRIWSGMMPCGWFRLLWRNRFKIGPTRIGMSLIIAIISVFNFGLSLIQSAIYGRRIRRTEISEAPVFVLGHWRSGTTLLHELLVADERHTYPDTYSCFAPTHFLFSRWLFKWWLGILLPSKRPMDNLRVGMDRPQEDEWAICNMGLPSPYLWLAFANNRPRQDQEYLDLRDVPPPALARWKNALMRYLKCLTIQRPKRIVLKSPQHTARIRALLDMFPDARFVHIVRDPYVIFPSTVRTWFRMSKFHGLQKPKGDDFEEFTFSTFTRMYDVFEEDRGLVAANRFCEIRYEDLVADPVGEMQRIYEQLELDDFEQARPAIQQYAEETKDYKLNRYELSPELREEITRRWHGYIERYGYEAPADEQ